MLLGNGAQAALRESIYCIVTTKALRGPAVQTCPYSQAAMQVKPKLNPQINAIQVKPLSLHQDS